MKMTCLWLLTLSVTAHAAKDVAPPCFNFKAAITAPLVPPPADDPKEPLDKTDPYDFGRRERDETKKRYDFAQVSGYVQAPVKKIFQLLTDPRTVRPDKTTEIQVKELPEPHFLKQIEQHIHIKPLPFVSVDWDERWAFSLVKGTAEQPETVLASYEKVAGTTHIRHFCGNILIQKVGPEKSLVYLWEEADAAHREAKDILNGLRGTLATLRGQKPAQK